MVCKTNIKGMRFSYFPSTKARISLKRKKKPIAGFGAKFLALSLNVRLFDDDDDSTPQDLKIVLLSLSPLSRLVKLLEEVGTQGKQL